MHILNFYLSNKIGRYCEIFDNTESFFALDSFKRPWICFFFKKFLCSSLAALESVSFFKVDVEMGISPFNKCRFDHFYHIKVIFKKLRFYFLQEDSISDSRNFSPLRFKHNVTKMITLRIPFVTLNNTFRIIFNCMVVEFSNMLSMFNELLRRHCIYKGSFCKFTY